MNHVDAEELALLSIVVGLQEAIRAPREAVGLVSEGAFGNGQQEFVGTQD